MRRHSIDRRKSKRNFSRGATHVHPKNMLMTGAPMRGGIRL